MTRYMVLLVFLATMGCGGASDRPAMAPVAGTVTYKDKPLAGATLGFHLEGEGGPRIGLARTDDEGRFRVTTYDTGDGAYIGTHIVTVVKQDPASVVGGENMEIGGDAYGKAMEEAANPKAAPPKQTLPESYAKKETSPLRLTVEAGGKTDATIVVE